MLVLLNYALNYASTIYQSLAESRSSLLLAPQVKARTEEPDVCILRLEESELRFVLNITFRNWLPL